MREMTRREAIGAAVAAAAGMALGVPRAWAQGEGPAVKRGRLKQSVSRWCYGRIPLPEFCGAAKEMGLAGKMAHVSTGGGAALEYLAQGTLPGIQALEQSWVMGHGS